MFSGQNYLIFSRTQRFLCQSDEPKWLGRLGKKLLGMIRFFTCFMIKISCNRPWIDFWTYRWLTIFFCDNVELVRYDSDEADWTTWSNLGSTTTYIIQLMFLVSICIFLPLTDSLLSMILVITQCKIWSHRSRAFCSPCNKRRYFCWGLSVEWLCRSLLLI